jgi:hypothetical protein
VRTLTMDEYAAGVDLEQKDTSGDGSNCETVDDVKSDDKKPLNSKVSIQNKNGSPATRRGTGPRTAQGKQKTKNNALKFGIFSTVAVLPGESQLEFQTLLSGLHDYFQPVGKMEQTLVERLAVDCWRYRRFLLAEGAEVQATTKFVEWDQKEQNREAAARFPQLGCNGGLIRWIGNPEALDGCLQLLSGLKESIKDDGFNPEWDNPILTKVYGAYDEEERKEDWQRRLRNSYLQFSKAAALPDNVRQERGLESPEVYKDAFVEELKDEIKRLEHYKKEQAAVLASKLKLESLRRSVPEGSQLERLLRYSAAISRDIERTLNQLERLQRMRCGQAVLPPINVNVTASSE